MHTPLHAKTEKARYFYFRARECKLYRPICGICGKTQIPDTVILQKRNKATSPAPCGEIIVYSLRQHTTTHTRLGVVDIPQILRKIDIQQRLCRSNGCKRADNTRRDCNRSPHIQCHVFCLLQPCGTHDA